MMRLKASYFEFIKIKPVLVVLLLAFFVGIGFLIKVDKVEALTCSDWCKQTFPTNENEVCDKGAKCELSPTDGKWHYCMCQWPVFECRVERDTTCNGSGCCIGACADVERGCYTEKDPNKCHSTCVGAGHTPLQTITIRSCSGCGSNNATGICNESSYTCNSSRWCEDRECGLGVYYCTNAGGSYAWRTSTACDDGNSHTINDQCVSGTCQGTFFNNCPNTPLLSGPTIGSPGTSYSFTAQATDPDNDQIRYNFDWGDGRSSNSWWVNSGQSVTLSHSWSSVGTYNVCVRAGDSWCWSSVRCQAIQIRRCNPSDACCTSSGDYASADTKCGTCKTCNSSGSCNQTPSDDSACGTIDCSGWYVQTGTEGVNTTEYCYNKRDITSNRCEGFGDCKDANTSDCSPQSNAALQYSCGTCQYIAQFACYQTNRGACSNYSSATQCGSTSCPLSNCCGDGRNYCTYPSSCTRYCSGSGTCNTCSCTARKNCRKSCGAQCDSSSDYSWQGTVCGYNCNTSIDRCSFSSSCTTKCSSPSSYCLYSNYCYYNVGCSSSGCSERQGNYCPATNVSGNTCYYGSRVCNSSGTCSYSNSDSSKPSTYYSSGSTCYYGCSVQCTSSGWSRTSCSSASIDDGNPCTTDSCTSSGVSRTTITSCINNDGCCPSGCNVNNDNDCSNRAPNQPLLLGPSSGVVGTSYFFTAQATDPDGDNVRYSFNWGDGSPESQTNYVLSGTGQSRSHSWSSQGIYTVYVVADDGDLFSSLQSQTINNISLTPLPNQSPTATTQGENWNYCLSSSQPILNWSFSDPDPGDTQDAYQVQIDNNSNFSSPEVDTGQVLSDSKSYTPLPNVLSFAFTYYWRVKVRDSKGAWSGWSNTDNFDMPLHRYPSPDFSWSPSNPTIGELVQFTDQTSFYNGASSWSWSFESALPANSSQRNPQVVFLLPGQKTVTLQATDSAGYSCSWSKEVKVTLGLPKWKEVVPDQVRLGDR